MNHCTVVSPLTHSNEKEKFVLSEGVWYLHVNHVQTNRLASGQTSEKLAATSHTTLLLSDH